MLISNSGPIFHHLPIKVHQITISYAGKFVVGNATF